MVELAPETIDIINRISNAVKGTKFKMESFEVTSGYAGDLRIEFEIRPIKPSKKEEGE